LKFKEREQGGSGNARAADQFWKKAKDGLLSSVSEEGISEVIPDAQLRVQFASKLACVLLDVHEGPLPVFVGWPDAPCAYLQFGSNPVYEPIARQFLLMPGWREIISVCSSSRTLSYRRSWI
jgi:hypothetical protein